ncbi:MAG: Methyltransferase type 11 [Chloroflexi bacterium OLB15]|nr:MAG: Methyltransferase type 11 [Chloroflexi bacterium OLB15]
MIPKDPKGLSQQRFGQYANSYTNSPRHFKGAELSHLVELAAPKPDWLALDVATGGGATALTFAPHVKQVIATDLTPKMLEAARSRIAPEATNILFSDGDAENLPFVENSFDLITCRIAPHHFPEPFRFVQEVARCLKPGGVFILQDLTVPDDEQAARFINSFERLRDPSHARMYAEYEWRGDVPGCRISRRAYRDSAPCCQHDRMGKDAGLRRCRDSAPANPDGTSASGCARLVEYLLRGYRRCLF